MKQSKKIRVEFKKNRAERTRKTDWTEQYKEHGFEEEHESGEERIGGKGELSRYRTVLSEDGGPQQGDQTADHDDDHRKLSVCESALSGRVIRVHGASSVVETEDGRQVQCVTRRLLKTLATDQRQPVVAGDRVLFRFATQHAHDASVLEGMIERVEPRHGTLSRESKHRKHILVTNVDQVLIIVSAAQPTFKPNLIDRLLLTAEQAGVRPIICISKTDLIDLADLQPVVGSYARMGYKVIPFSTINGFGIDRIRQQLTDRESVVTGQSGVGKSSLLNAVEPSLNLRVSELGSVQKGKHTTTTAELIKLSFGGYVVDTPGMRQFMLWDVIPEEVCGFYRDLRPYENFCRFPDCTHSHEEDCAVQNAVAEGRLDLRRYESCLAIRAGEMES